MAALKRAEQTETRVEGALWILRDFVYLVLLTSIEKNRRFAPFQVPHVSCGRFVRRSTATNKRHSGDKRGGRILSVLSPRGEPSRAEPTLAQHSHLPSPIERDPVACCCFVVSRKRSGHCLPIVEGLLSSGRASPYRSSDGPPSHLLHTQQDLSSFPAARAGTYHGRSLLIRKRPPGSIHPPVAVGSAVPALNSRGAVGAILSDPYRGTRAAAPSH
jgi:hypothetical protein